MKNFSCCFRYAKNCMVMSEVWFSFEFLLNAKHHTFRRNIKQGCVHGVQPTGNELAEFMTCKVMNLEGFSAVTFTKSNHCIRVRTFNG